MIQSIKVIVTRLDDANPSIARQESAESTSPTHGPYDQTATDLLQRCLTQHPRKAPSESRSASTTRQATEKQIRAIEAIAKNQGFDLQQHLESRLNATDVRRLSITQASKLIDYLKHQPSA